MRPLSSCRLHRSSNCYSRTVLLILITEYAIRIIGTIPAITKIHSKIGVGLTTVNTIESPRYTKLITTSTTKHLHSKFVQYCSFL
jgi:hypothetical protein